MLNDVTISLDLNQLLGGDIDTRRTRVYVSTNVPNNTLIDTSTGEIRLGDEKVTVETDGTGSFTTWGVGADGNPTSWQTTVTVEYARVGARDRQIRTFGPFTIADADDGKMLAELEDQQAVPPNYQTTFTTSMETIRDEAEAARDAAVDISNIDTSDAVVEALVLNTGGAGPLTSAALSASYDRSGRIDARNFAADKSTITAEVLTAAVEAADGKQVLLVGDIDLGASGWNYTGTKAVNLVGTSGVTTITGLPGGVDGITGTVISITGTSGEPVNIRNIEVQAGGAATNNADARHRGIRIENRTGPVTVERARVRGCTNQSAVRIVGGSVVRVEGCDIADVFNTLPTKSSTGAIHITGVANKVLVTNNVVVAGADATAADIGIFLVGHQDFSFFVTEVIVSGNQVSGFGRHAIGATHEQPASSAFYSGELVITKNVVRDCAEQGIKVKLQKRVTITDNVIADCNTVPELAGELDGGINVQSASELVVTGNTIINDGTDGIRVDVKWPSAADGEDGTLGRANRVIANNTILDCAEYGIRVGTGSSDTAITGNTIVGSGSTGIYLYPGASATSEMEVRRISVTGNIVRNSGAVGISANSFDDVTITGNTITMSQTFGIFADNGTGLVIVGNTVLDSAQATTPSSAYGIRIGAVTEVLIVGNRSGNRQTTSQTHGISLSQAAVCANNYLDGNTSAPIQGSANVRGQFLNGAVFSKAAAYTQTYSTATRTHSTFTSTAVATTPSTSTTPFGYTTQDQADAIVTSLNALRQDVANAKQVLNSVIDDLQAYGLL